MVTPRPGVPGKAPPRALPSRAAPAGEKKGSASGASRPVRAGGGSSAGVRQRPAPGPAKNKTPLIIGAAVGAVVLIVLIVAGTGGGKSRGARSSGALQTLLDEAYALMEQKQYLEADDKLHHILNQRERRSETAYGKAAELDAGTLHALAAAEREARPQAEAWLSRAETFFSDPNRTPKEGAPLYDEGLRLRDHYPNYSRSDAIRAKVDDLARYKAEDATAGSQERYQEIAQEAKARIREHDYAGAVRLWGSLNSDGLSGDFSRKLNTRIDEVNAHAREWLDELARDAERRGGGDGRRLLEEARPKLKGTEVEKDLEDRIQRLK